MEREAAAHGTRSISARPPSTICSLGLGDAPLVGMKLETPYRAATNL